MGELRGSSIRIESPALTPHSRFPPPQHFQVTHIDVQRPPVIGANGLAPLLVAPGESVTAFLALAVNATTMGTPRQTRIATVVSRKKLWVGILGNSTEVALVPICAIASL
jgi:hypothetical protein